MWFDRWYEIGRVVVASAAAYVALVVSLRVSGKRTLAKLNAFDLVVTIALGSTLATIALSSDVAIVEGVTAFAVLVALQYVVAWSSTRSTPLTKAVRSAPVAVVRDGDILHGVIKAQRLTVAEVHQAVRSSGIGGMELVAAVVLETDGTMSVVASEQRGSGSAMPGADDRSDRRSDGRPAA